MSVFFTDWFSYRVYLVNGVFQSIYHHVYSNYAKAQAVHRLTSLSVTSHPSEALQGLVSDLATKELRRRDGGAWSRPPLLSRSLAAMLDARVLPTQRRARGRSTRIALQTR